jgi:hypothetical protein
VVVLILGYHCGAENQTLQAPLWAPSAFRGQAVEPARAGLDHQDQGLKAASGASTNCWDNLDSAFGEFFRIA